MTGDSETPQLSPDEAFSVLGNETRVQILRELGTAGEPLAFSALYDRLDLTDSAQFNYHLDKLVGHFVYNVDGEYALARPGERVIEAIRSGAVTDDPQLERTTVEQSCSDCGRTLQIQWRNGSVELFCGSCEGRWDQSWGRVGGPSAVEGYLGRLPFPPAGLDGRSPAAVYRAAHVWSNLEMLAICVGLCPRCSATVDRELHVCPDHEAGDSPCETCESTFEVRLSVACTNCIYSVGAGAAMGLLTAPELLGFLLDHDLNPLDPDNPHRLDSLLNDYDERVYSTDPFEAEFVFTLDGDELSLRVDRSLAVLEATR